MNDEYGTMNADYSVGLSARAVHRSSFIIHRFRRGFSFAEVMFAVVVLGIGFIMVAAIFPVAIKQSQATAEESFAAAVSRNGVSYLEQLANRKPTRCVLDASYTPDVSLLHATDLLLSGANLSNRLTSPPRAMAAAASGQMLTPGIETPGTLAARGKLLAMGDWRVVDKSDDPTADYFPLRSMQLRETAGGMIVPADTRYAWIPMYRRDRSYNYRFSTGGSVAITDPNTTYEDSPVAQVVVFGVQTRNRTNFDQRDLPLVPPITAGLPQYKLANLQPRPVAVRVVPETFFNPAGSPSTFVAQFFSVRLLDGDTPRGGYPASASIDQVLDASPDAVAEGAYFVISDDRILNDPSNDPLSASVAGTLNGRIYRVGTPRPDLGPTVWDLYPGFDFIPDPGANGVFDAAASTRKDDLIAIGVSLNNVTASINNQICSSNVQVDGTPATPTGGGQGAVAFVMGRGLSESYLNNNSANPGPPTFDGTAMDVSVYTSVIKVK